jgi:hypothetical protein
MSRQVPPQHVVRAAIHVALFIPSVDPYSYRAAKPDKTFVGATPFASSGLHC